MSRNILKTLSFSFGIAFTLAALSYAVYPVLETESLQTRKGFTSLIWIEAMLATLFMAVALRICPLSVSIRRQTLFVGNLAFKASETELRKLFGQHGEVFSIRLMLDKVTRKPRGYGFVEMDEGGAKKAIAALNEQEFMGRPLRVSTANEPGRNN